MKSRDNFEELELRFQELKNSLNKKADHEGMKKGLAFLEAKINQVLHEIILVILIFNRTR